MSTSYFLFISTFWALSISAVSISEDFLPGKLYFRALFMYVQFYQNIFYICVVALFGDFFYIHFIYEHFLCQQYLFVHFYIWAVSIYIWTVSISEQCLHLSSDFLYLSTLGAVSEQFLSEQFLYLRTFSRQIIFQSTFYVCFIRTLSISEQFLYFVTFSSFILYLSSFYVGTICLWIYISEQFLYIYMNGSIPEQ